MVDNTNTCLREKCDYFCVWVLDECHTRPSEGQMARWLKREEKKTCSVRVCKASILNA